MPNLIGNHQRAEHGQNDRKREGEGNVQNEQTRSSLARRCRVLAEQADDDDGRGNHHALVGLADAVAERGETGGGHDAVNSAQKQAAEAAAAVAGAQTHGMAEQGDALDADRDYRVDQ
jgi:hypothetical protein